MIDTLRETHRVKYANDYNLRKVGKNKFQVLPGTTCAATVWQEEIEHWAMKLEVSVSFA